MIGRISAEITGRKKLLRLLARAIQSFGRSATIVRKVLMVRLRKKYLETGNGLFTQRKLIITAFRDIIGFSGVCW